MIIKCPLTSPELMSRPLQSRPAHINFPSNLRLDPIDSKSSFYLLGGNFLLPRYYNGVDCMECRGGGALYLVLFQRISVNLSGPKENVFENPMRVRDDKISDVRMMTRMT